jgi:hypothetical protein
MADKNHRSVQGDCPCAEDIHSRDHQFHSIALKMARLKRPEKIIRVLGKPYPNWDRYRDRDRNGIRARKIRR